MINDIAQYRVFSTIDLQSAYHQVPLRKEERPYTAFEASYGLYQFTRVPFGVTNGVAYFQRVMSDFVREEKLSGVFPYLDNISICGKDQAEHDANLKLFLEAAKRKNMTYHLAGDSWTCVPQVSCPRQRWNPWLMKWSSSGQTRTMPTSVTLMVEQQRCPPST